jgi:hypothetical protein
MSQGSTFAQQIKRSSRSRARPPFLLWLVGLTIVSSVFHYADNFLRYEQYPQSDPALIHVTKPMIWQAWLVFTALGVIGYMLYRRGRPVGAGMCLALFSIGGLISPLHYLGNPLSGFDALQHTFILADGVLGLAVLVFAIALIRTRDRRSRHDSLSRL